MVNASLYPVADPPPVGEGKDEVDGDGLLQEPLDQTLADSFPASDPPYWTTGCESK